jgi:FlaA1/EpsC-like NDP-sugar epimerase
MNKVKHTLIYICFDFIGSAIAWAAFFFFRKIYIETKFYGETYLAIDQNFFLGIIFIPLFWLFLYYLTGYYSDIYRRSRLKELSTTFAVTLFGVLIIFFKLILDDIIVSYTDYYNSLLFLFFTQFFLIYIPRLIITSRTINRIHEGKIGFPTLLVGSNGESARVYKEIVEMKRKPGNKFIGYVNIYDKKNEELEKNLMMLGKFEDLPHIINDNEIEEVIIAIEEERLRRVKHWAGFPALAIKACLDEVGLKISDIDHIKKIRI